MWAALFGLIAVCSTIVFSAGSSGSRRRRALVGDAEREADRGGAIEEHVDVAVRRGDGLADAGDRPERGDDLGGDGARRLAQAAGQLEGDGAGEVAHRPRRRRLQHDRRDRRGLERVEAEQRVGERGAHGRVEAQDHRSLGLTRSDRCGTMRRITPWPRAHTHARTRLACSRSRT